MTRQTALRLMGAACALALALGACTSNPEPRPLPAPSPTKSADPSPSASQTAAESPPTMPAAAKGTSKASAKAFVRHWVELLNYSGPSGRTHLLRKASAETCAACGGIADAIDDVAQTGGHIIGSGWSVRSMRVVTSQPELTVVDAVVFVHRQMVIEHRGAEPQIFTPGRRLKTFYLSPTDGTWAVTRLDQPT